MPCAAWLPVVGQLQGGAHHILDVNEGPHGVPSSMKLHRLAGSGTQQGARNDAIELLPWAIHVGGSGEHHGEAISLMEAVEMQVASCPAHGIGGAGAEVVVLFDPTAIGAAVHLRGGHVNIFLEKRFLAQCIVQSHLGDHVGAVPMGGVEPAFGHHALGGEIHHQLRLNAIDQFQQIIQLAVEINRLKLEVLRCGEGWALPVEGPAVRKEHGVRFR